jgi:competence protein ComEA
MSSITGEPQVLVAAHSPGALSGPWPVGVRGLLTALGMLAALGIRAADRSVGPGAGAVCNVTPRLVIDPNTAPPVVLGALPHVGPSMVRKLVEQRELRPFASMEDMRRRVRGLGPATMARLAPHLQISPGRDRIPDAQDTVVPSIPSRRDLAQGPVSTRPR